MTQTNEHQPGETPNNRIIYLGSVLDDETCGRIMGGMIGMNIVSPTPIHLIINSPGGSAYQMFAIYDVIKACSCPIWTFGVGSVMSAAVPLLASGEKGERRISSRARLLIHSISAGVFGDMEFLKTYMAELSEIQKTYEEVLVEESNISAKQVKKLMDGKDHFFSAAEAVKYGLADKIVR